MTFFESGPEVTRGHQMHHKARNGSNFEYSLTYMYLITKKLLKELRSKLTSKFLNVETDASEVPDFPLLQ